MIAFHHHGKTLALTAAALFAAGITLSTPHQAQAASKTGNFLLGAVAGAAGLAVLHGISKKKRRVYEPAPRRYYRRAPARRYYAPRTPPSPVTMKIQESLNILGFNVGAVDGRAGPATRAGARAFQVSINQPATGYLTEMQKSILFQKAQAVLTGVPANPAPPAGYPAASAAPAAPAYAPPPAAPAPAAPATYATPPAAPAYTPPPATAAPAAPAYVPPPPIQPAPAQ
jgi:hypothetical protein